MRTHKHNLSKFVNTSGFFGTLYPCGLYEVLPGDRWSLSTSIFMRLAAMVAPPMHPTEVTLQWFFVPHTLVWDEWESFITGGDDGMGDGYTFPTIDMTVSGAGLIPDYMGYGRTDTGSYTINAMPVRSYHLIWSKYYRDQDIYATGSADAGTDETLVPRKVCVEKDRFTTLRPWETLGDEVTIPLFDDIPVSGIGQSGQTYLAGPVNAYETDGTGAASYANYRNTASSATYTEEDPNNAGYPNVRAEGANVNNPATINDLRQAMALNRFQEIRARYGHRYAEYCQYIAGKAPRNTAIDEPIYLGGGRSTINFSEVIQTAEGTNPVGELYGHGVAGVRTKPRRFDAYQHGYLIPMIHVRAKQMYLQHIDKVWTKYQDRNQYYQREYEDVGMDATLVRELYGNSTDNTTVLGYGPRYDEYRHALSYAAGEFRNALDHWTMAERFSSDPALNSAFLAHDPNDDIFANAAEANFRALINHRALARRIVKPVSMKRRLGRRF